MKIAEVRVPAEFVVRLDASVEPDPSANSATIHVTPREADIVVGGKVIGTLTLGGDE